MYTGAESVAEFQALSRFRDVLQSASSHEEILEAVCDAIETLLGVRRVSVQVISPSGQTRFQVSRGLSGRYRKLIEERWRSIFDPFEPRTFVSPHVEGDEREPLWREIVAEGIGALVSVPLLTQGKLLGKLVAYHSTPHAFTRHEIELVESVAHTVAIAVARHQADEAREQSLKELRLAQDELKAYHDLVTHDVTNHAGILSGLVEHLLGAGTFSEEQRDLLRRAKRQLFQLTQLAENAKTLSRVREKGLSPSGPPLRLRELMERAADRVRAVHFDRPLHVDLDCPAALELPGIPFLDGIFLILFDNIVRHTPADQAPIVQIRVAVEQGRIRVSLRGGPPPDEDLLSHLFERHRPGVRSTGASLGMALIREVVGRVGGDVRAGIATGPGGRVFEVVLTFPGGGS